MNGGDLIIRQLTCNVVMCLSLNLFSTYLSTREVFPTAPSPNNTTLNERLGEPGPAPAILSKMLTRVNPRTYTDLDDVSTTVRQVARNIEKWHLSKVLVFNP